MRKIIRAGILTLAFVLAFTTLALAESTRGMPITARHKFEKGAPYLDLNKHDMTLKKGKTETLKAVLRPSGEPVSVFWYSSNPKIATVSTSGKVKAIAPGITVISTGSLLYEGIYDQTGFSGVCFVTVQGEAKDAKPLGVNDYTYNYGKTKLTAPTGNYNAAIANVLKSVGGFSFLENQEGLGYYEGVYLGSNDRKKAHTEIYILSNDKGPIGYGYYASGKSPIKTSRGIAIGTKKSVVKQQYGLPVSESEELLGYHVKTTGKGFYTRMTFLLSKTKGTVTTIIFYLGEDYNNKK